MLDSETEASTDPDGWVYGYTPSVIAEKSRGNVIPRSDIPSNGSENTHQGHFFPGARPQNNPKNILDNKPRLRRRRLVRVRIVTKVESAQEGTVKFLEMLRRRVEAVTFVYICLSLFWL